MPKDTGRTKTERRDIPDTASERKREDVAFPFGRRGHKQIDDEQSALQKIERRRGSFSSN